MQLFTLRKSLTTGVLAAALLAAPAAYARGGQAEGEATCPTAPQAVPELGGSQATMAGALLVGAFLLLTSRRRQQIPQA